jgi:hypothetical protein
MSDPDNTPGAVRGVIGSTAGRAVGRLGGGEPVKPLRTSEAQRQRAAGIPQRAPEVLPLDDPAWETMRQLGPDVPANYARFLAEGYDPDAEDYVLIAGVPTLRPVPWDRQLASYVVRRRFREKIRA